MNRARLVRNDLKECSVLFAMIGCLALLTAQVHAQTGTHFVNSFDTPPTLQKNAADDNEGYIVVEDGQDSLEVSLATSDFRGQMRNDPDVKFQYWITPAMNMLDLEYTTDSEMKQKGAGSLNVKFKRGSELYYSGTEVIMFFPPFDARGADIRFWLRSENDAGKAVYVYLLDEMYRPCEHWSFYNPVIEQWHQLKITQGKQLDASIHKPNKSYAGDIKRVSGILIRLYAYEEDRAADYHLDEIRVTPAPRPRIYFESVMEIKGECHLRPEAGVDGISERWFDPQTDEKDWKKASIPQFWDKENDPTAWYRIRFSLSDNEVAAIAGKPAYMLFKGVDESAWVWLNGEKLGSHSEDRKEGWDKPFAFDVTKHLKTEGENLLAVKVLNREQAGGIWRPVSIVTEKPTSVPKTPFVR